MPARTLLAVCRLGLYRVPLVPISGGEMLFEPLVAFAGAPLEALTIDDLKRASAARDQILRGELLNHGIHRRSLDPEQARRRLPASVRCGHRR